MTEQNQFKSNRDKPKAAAPQASSSAEPAALQALNAKSNKRRTIKHSYEKKTGKLHADNANHPGVTEADIEEVLNNPALLEQDEDKPWKWYATGPTSGKYDSLTVVYVPKADSLDTITAHPPNKTSSSEYDRLKKEGKLWLPVGPTPKKI